MSNLPIAVLISGAGSTLSNLIQWRRNGELPVDIRLVISSRADAKGLEFAREAGIPCEIVTRNEFPTAAEHSEHLFGLCRQHAVELVAMGGFIEHVIIPDDFANRVLNIHPALIPAFSGKGFYGMRVHSAALEYGVKISGCSVHYVDNELDHGPIIAQRACPVLPEDTPETLSGRVAELERQLYPEVIAAIARGLVSTQGRLVTIRAIV